MCGVFLLKSKLDHVMCLSAKLHIIWLRKGKNLTIYHHILHSFEFFCCTYKEGTEVNLRENHYQNEITKAKEIHCILCYRCCQYFLFCVTNEKMKQLLKPIARKSHIQVNVNSLFCPFLFRNLSLIIGN